MKNTKNTLLSMGMITTALLVVGCNDENPQNQSSEQHGYWQLSDSNDAGDRFYRATIEIEVDSANLPIKPALYVGCSQWQFEGYEIEPSYLGVYLQDNNLKQPHIEYSFDKVKWNNGLRWKAPTNKGAGSGLQERYVRSFSKSLLNHNTLYMKVTADNSSVRDLTFNISGYENAVKDIRTLCKW